MTWHQRWAAIGAVLSPLVFYCTRERYFGCEIPFPSFIVPTPSSCSTVYGGMSKAQGIYFVSILAAYLALYVLWSLNARKISRREAAIHLVAWTLVPPLWFSYERYYFFRGLSQEAALLPDTAAQKLREHEVKALKEGQEYAAQLWSAVLAVLLAFKLGEIVTQSKEQRPVPNARKVSKRTKGDRIAGAGRERVDKADPKR